MGQRTTSVKDDHEISPGSKRDMNSRSSLKTAETGSSEIPEVGRQVLADSLGGSPYRLYVADGKESDPSFVLTLSSGIDLEPRDEWSMELARGRTWAALPRGELVPLKSLAGRSGLSAPDPQLRLRAIWQGERLAGGLLVRVQGSSTAAGRLREPLLDHALSLLLRLWTERKQQRELRGFRTAVASALPYGFLAIDPLGRVTDAGGRAAAILGWSERELVGSDCARVFRPVGLSGNPLLDAFARIPDRMELHLARPDGREVPISLEMTRVASGAGRSKSVVAFFQDLSEERALEDAERQRDRLAVLGELSAGVAHEIRNPLTGIANCAQVLAEGLDPDDSRQRFLKIILDETARLNRIVEGLLSYARPNQPELRETSLEECVRHALELVRPGMEEKGIRVSLRLVGRIPKTYIDPSQTTQILLNLLRNAEESMPSGGELRVEMSVIRRRPHRRRGTGRRATDLVRRTGATGPLMRFVQIRISDTGHGIPRDLLPRVFNPFFTTRSRGTGLGLSLCQSMVREHGGFLTLQSVENKGTTVHLDLPVERRQGERRKEPR
jgi:two-component system, NtrC family, nitrogen regulation sensor histidine kinase GlnL